MAAEILRPSVTLFMHDTGPQDLITESQCLQIAIDKIHLRLLCLAYVSIPEPHHHHGALTMLTFAKRLPMLSAICLVQ